MDTSAAPPTEKLYLQDTYLLTCETSILVFEVATDDAPAAIVLTKTVFHPQGGGQPSDIGTLTAEGFSFEVSSVKQVMSFENWYLSLNYYTRHSLLLFLPHTCHLNRLVIM
jgi:Ser-tRNA(Ala) deacylase AlaX